MSKRFDDDCLYIVQIINPHTNDDYILENSINEIVAFEDRYDAIDYAKKYIKKRLHVEYFRVYLEFMFMLERLHVPLQIIRRKVKNKEEK
jgi:hypothetical protein